MTGPREFVITEFDCIQNLSKISRLIREYNYTVIKKGFAPPILGFWLTEAVAIPFFRFSVNKLKLLSFLNLSTNARLFAHTNEIIKIKANAVNFILKLSFRKKDYENLRGFNWWVYSIFWFTTFQWKFFITCTRHFRNNGSEVD